jgi:hypothetical protein
MTRSGLRDLGMSVGRLFLCTELKGVQHSKLSARVAHKDCCEEILPIQLSAGGCPCFFCLLIIFSQSAPSPFNFKKARQSFKIFFQNLTDQVEHWMLLRWRMKSSSFSCSCDQVENVSSTYRNLLRGLWVVLLSAPWSWQSQETGAIPWTLRPFVRRTVRWNRNTGVRGFRTCRKSVMLSSKWRLMSFRLDLTDLIFSGIFVGANSQK